MIAVAADLHDRHRFRDRASDFFAHTIDIFAEIHFNLLERTFNKVTI